MHEINPVLAGTFDAPDYAPSNNFASSTNSATDQVSGSDDRRYTKFDHSDTEAGTATMSFSDLVDMFNPLEHIPVVSSVYRAITGEEINPVSRIAGDILYGGIFGAASAVLGGVSAIADAGLEQETGKDSGGIAIAALFGPDNNNPVQMADAGPKTDAAAANAPAPVLASAAPYATQNIELAQSATPTPLLAALSVPASSPPPPRSVDTAAPDVLAPNEQSAPAATVDAAAAAPTAPAMPADGVTSNLPPAAPQTPAPVSGIPSTSASMASDQVPAGGIPLLNPKSSSPGKQAFGGVMGVPNMQAQEMAVALSQGAPTMRMGHRIYTKSLVNGAHSLPPMLSSGNAQTVPAPVIAPAPVLPASFAPPPSGPAASAHGNGSPPALASASVSSNQTPLSAALMQDMMLKALGQYGSVTAGSSFGTGSAVNFMN